ncbi:MAG: hypothetical protein IPN51_13480 [Chloracidobacterium sp.]|nr:hypothetical protein [Chloracidobacterium sp.]
MKFSITSILIVFATLAIGNLGSVQAQTAPTSSRVIVTSTLPPAKAIATPAPRPVQTPIDVSSAPPTVQAQQATNINRSGLSFAQIKAKIAEARRIMQVRPLTTASAETTVPIFQNSLIRIAFYDWRTRQIDNVVLSKEQFLTASVPSTAVAASGKQFVVTTVRANGVNTPVTIADESGQQQLPLVVQYPRENNGVFQEMAYYVSTHAGLITPEVVNAGQFYVRNVIEIARERLSERGITIQPKVADIAERLATVEHVDHLRFRTEYHPNIYNDIFTLYALNEGQTYRYSVSSAGAGGMVQMIPSTYRMVRARFPGVYLMPDFVEGMRDHVNAAKVMLLYMQMTWNDLTASPTVANALQTGIATPEQLMAAGYNSNPAKLPGYINRGGQNWTTLIPRETKIYLQIYESLERAVPMNSRNR